MWYLEVNKILRCFKVKAYFLILSAQDNGLKLKELFCFSALNRILLAILQKMQLSSVTL